MNYSEKLKDPRWQQLRLRVFERDGWKCRNCDTESKTLHAHHAAYHPNSDGPWDYDPETIVTLCHECHEIEHAELKAMQANLLLAVAKRGFWSSFSLDMLTLAIERGEVL